MQEQQTHPPLDDEARAVVAEAQSMMRAVADGLRDDLLARAGDVTVEIKDDGTPVTAADLEANERIVAAVHEHFPDHAVVSEELDTTYDGTPWTWVVDPIDGTSNFTAGLPYWCVSVGLTHEGHAVFGFVDAPPIDARFEAVLGDGATRNGVPIQVRDRVDFDDRRNKHVPLFLTTGTARRSRPGLGLNMRVMGSAALDLCLVAQGVGAASVSVQPKVWDVAAGMLLVTEAGGSYVTLEGPPLLPMRTDTDYLGRSAPCRGRARSRTTCVGSCARSSEPGRPSAGRHRRHRCGRPDATKGPPFGGPFVAEERGTVTRSARGWRSCSRTRCPWSRTRWWSSTRTSSRSWSERWWPPTWSRSGWSCRCRCRRRRRQLP